MNEFQQFVARLIKERYRTIGALASAVEMTGRL
jgi:hypothetical protein